MPTVALGAGTGGEGWGLLAQIPAKACARMALDIEAADDWPQRRANGIPAGRLMAVLDPPSFRF